MKLITENKLLSSIVGGGLLLFIINFSINYYAASKIKEEINKFITDSEMDNIKYDDISYSFLTSTISIYELEIKMGKGEYFNSEKINLSIDRDNLPSIEDFKSGDFSSIELSDVEIVAEGLKLVNDEVIMKLDFIEQSFNGKINPSDEIISVSSSDLSFSGLSIRADGVVLEVGELESELDFNELIDIKGLFNDPEKLSNIEDFMFSLSTSGVEIPNEILKEMDLDNLGIIGLVEDLNLELDLEKDEDNMSLELTMGSSSVGEFDIECDLDFSIGLDDPLIELDIELSDLNSGIYEILRNFKLDKNGDDGFEFEYKGLLSKLDFK
ncbi:hypothetical protein N9839_00855 [Flavobacteriaceae bacterium]|nr:hypothetical protein [Flavobacteriaceae bacterium]